MLFKTCLPHIESTMWNKVHVKCWSELFKCHTRSWYGTINHEQPFLFPRVCCQSKKKVKKNKLQFSPVKFSHFFLFNSNCFPSPWSNVMLSLTSSVAVCVNDFFLQQNVSFCSEGSGVIHRVNFILYCHFHFESRVYKLWKKKFNTLNTPTSVCIFSILISTHFLKSWQGGFV